MIVSEIINTPPFSMEKAEKRRLFNQSLGRLTRLHYGRCAAYRRMMDACSLNVDHLPEYDKLPVLPVRLFKEFELKSIPAEEVIKTMTSSGTSGQQVSKIYLDRTTSANQTKVLTKIVSSFIGTKRVPMLILDTSNVLKNRSMFSARGAGILGFSMFGSKRVYALSENMEIDVEQMKIFLEEHQGEKIFMFGFTFMIWQHFYRQLLSSGYRPDLSKGILIHGGGWKKLLLESVSSNEFKGCLNDVCGIESGNIHEYYGMVEQTGSIYMECECGYLHAPIFSDVIIRRHRDFSLVNVGEKGLIEVVSILPESYPGHLLLTEDEGMFLGEDDCVCGRKGKYFKIEGRIKNAEIRGCSDTYAARF